VIDAMQSLALMGLILLFLYPFAIYPVMVAWLARNRRWKTSGTQGREVPQCPKVALVICALNEERIIRQKLENSLALNYPAGMLRIVVISDGSTDGTAQIALEFCRAGVEVVDQPVRRGKITNLNEVIPAREEDIVVLSDANVMYHADAVRRIVERFRDSSVGCVSGKVILQDTTPDLNAPTEQYYSLEWALQENSSAVYSMPGADGAMYG
jgi:cellulose synthase/poly-beta-1,6-N-acetylglucosamine synthase-like glycosyltransferase